MSLLWPLVGVVFVATTAGGGGRLRESDFPAEEEGDGDVRAELVGEVNEEVLGRAWALREVKEEARGRDPREGEGDRGEVK